MAPRIDGIRGSIFGLVLLLWTLPHSIHAHHGKTAIAIPLANITIDGKLDDWPEKMAVYPIEWVHPTAYKSAPPDGPEDLTASFRVGYNLEKNLLYLAVVTRDDEQVVHPESPGFSNQDLCEVYVDADHSGGDSASMEGRGGKDAQQYLLVAGLSKWYPTADGNPALAPASTDTRLSGVEGAYLRSGWYTVYEWAIPLFTQFPEQPFRIEEGKVVGFDVAIADADGTDGANWVAWTAGSLKVTDSSLFGDLKFAEDYGGAGAIADEIEISGIDRPEAYGEVGTIAGKIEILGADGFGERGYLELLKEGQVVQRITPDSTGAFHLTVLQGTYIPRAFARGVRDTVVSEAVVVSGGQEIVLDLELEDLGTCFHVDDDAPEGGDGTREHPFRTIAQALAVTNNGDTVQVAAGTYPESVELVSGVTLLGAGSDSTFIDGEERRAPLVRMRNVQNVVLEGFAMVRGQGISLPISGFFTERHGGLYISSARHVRIARNLIAGNVSVAGGGGITCFSCDSTVVIAHNLIVGNESLSPSATNEGGGGIIIGSGSRAQIQHNTVVYNRANGSGGGILCSGSSPYLHDNIVAFNLNGGIAFERPSYMSPEAIGPGPRLSRNVVWGNTPGDYAGLELGEDDASVDPQFADPERGDFRLAPSSPVRDVGATEDALPRSAAGLRAATPPEENLKSLRQQTAGAVSRPVRLVDVTVPTPRKLRVDTVEVEVDSLDLGQLGLQEKAYDRSDGLPGSQVMAAVPAPDGSIWFGTDRGAARYDGLWTYLDTADGLLDNEVTEILPVADGTVWIATRTGVVRVRDGQIETPERVENLSHLTSDPGGGVWIGSRNERSVHLDSARTEYAFADSAGQAVYSNTYPLFAEEEGTTWWILDEGISGLPGTRTPLLMLYDPDGVKTRTYELFRGIDANAQQLEPGPGGFWLPINEIKQLSSSSYTSVARSVAFLDTAAATLRLYRLPPDWEDYQYSIIPDRDGVLWLFGWNQTLQFDGRRWLGTRDETLATTANAEQDAAGDFWFASYSQGGVRYGSLAWTTFEGEDKLAGKWVGNVVEDRQGNLWFGGEGGLAQRRKDGSWGQPAVTDSFVTDLLLDRRGHIWAAGPNEMHRFDGERWTAYGAEHGVPDTSIFSLAEGPQGKVWAGTQDGLFRFGERGWEEVEVSSWESGYSWESPRNISELFRDSQNRLWIGTGAGLYVHDGEEIKDYYEFFYPQRNIHLDDLFALEEPDAIRRALKEKFTEKEDLAWFVARVRPHHGSSPDENASLRRLKDAYRALYEEDPEFQALIRQTVEAGYIVERYSEEESDADLEWQVLTWLGTDRIQWIVTGTDGEIWFITQRGLFAHRDGEWLRKPASSLPVPPYSIRASRVDRSGNLWLATGQGAARYDGQEWVLFDVGDGLASNEVSDVLEDREGNIWFATGKGITRYRPDSRPPQTRVLRGPEGRVGYGTEALTFQFEGGDWESERRVAFAHALVPAGQEPQVEDWSAWSAETFTEVRIEDLGWGAFTFHVRARDRALNADPTPATWPLTIAMPLWAKGWFQASVGFGLLLILFSSTYAARKQRQARRAERALMQEMEEELQTAHDMQMGLMPTESPRIRGFKIAGHCLPANHVGGDFFQYFQRNGTLSVCMADVTGHAMEAAVPVMMFSGVLKTEMRLGVPVDQLFSNLNNTMHDSLDSRTYVCFTMGEIDLATRVLHLANGGCPYPFHFHDGEVRELQVDAYPLGVRAEASYRVVETALEPDDYVVFCSDGIIEAANVREEIFGFEQTAETISTGCVQGLSAEELIEQLIGEVKEFAGETPQGDDMTVVVLRVEA